MKKLLNSSLTNCGMTRQTASANTFANDEKAANGTSERKKAEMMDDTQLNS